MPNDIRTKAIVLRRTNYGETDRILNLLTPKGKYSVLAKGVRKEKSRLAGGIEMFCISDVTIHEGRSSLATLTSAKMLDFYQNLLTDLTRLELASQILKQINKVTDQIDSPDFFDILVQSLSALNSTYDTRLVEAWFLFNLAKASGSPTNLHFDTSGDKLTEDKTYSWDSIESSLAPAKQGNITANHIKLMRLLTVADLTVASRVKNHNDLLNDILYIARSI